MDFTVQGENQSDRMLRESVGRIARHTCHGDVQLLGNLQIHIIESRTAQRNHPDAGSCQAFEDFAVNDIVDKYGQRLCTGLCRAANSPLKACKPGPYPLREIRGIARFLSAFID